MKKIILAMLLVLFGFISLAHAQYDNVDRIAKSIVLVESVSENESTYCTGFVVSELHGEVLTARHCVPEDSLVYIDNETSRILRQTETMTLLAIPPLSRRSIPMAKHQVHVFDKVWAFGLVDAKLNIIGLYVQSVVNDDFTVSGQIFNGMSGGPIVDDNGKLVGLNMGNLTNSRTGVACGIDEIRKFLDWK